MKGDIAGIIFDKDGTLFDFRATWSVWATRFFGGLAGGDAVLAARLAAPLGFDYERRAFASDSVIIAGTPREVSDALLGALPGRDPEALVDHVNRVSSEVRQVEAVPLAPLLATLGARGLTIGLATNDAEAPARAHLESVGIGDAFDFVAGYDSGFGAKPEPGMLVAFCERTGIAAEACLMVGDSLHDLVSGRRAGMSTLGVLTGLADSADLAPFADAVLDDIGHIPAWLDAPREG